MSAFYIFVVQSLLGSYMKHLDLSYIKTNVTDDEEFIRELLDVFSTSLSIDLTDFDAAVASEDHGKIKRAAHKVKSSFRSLGMTEMASLMQRIENLGHEKQPLEEVRDLSVKLHAEIPAIHQEVKDYMAA